MELRIISLIDALISSLHKVIFSKKLRVFLNLHLMDLMCVSLRMGRQVLVKLTLYKAYIHK